MKEKLSENNHKKGWESCSDNYLFRRLDEEFTELKIKIASNAKTKEVIRECADVANFAMMIADNYEEE